MINWSPVRKGETEIMPLPVFFQHFLFLFFYLIYVYLQLWPVLSDNTESKKHLNHQAAWKLD